MDDWGWVLLAAAGAFVLWRLSQGGGGNGGQAAPTYTPPSGGETVRTAQRTTTADRGTLTIPTAAVYGTFAGANAAASAHEAAAQLAAQYPGHHFAVVQSGASYDPTYQAVLASTTGALPVTQIRSTAASEGIVPTVSQLNAAPTTAQKDAIIASDLGTLVGHGGTAADVAAYLQQEWGYGTTEAQSAAQSVALTGTWYGKSLGTSVRKGPSTGG